MSRLPRFSFLAPSAGEKLLARATGCKIEFSRWPAGDVFYEPLDNDAADESDAPTVAAEDRPREVEISFELHGTLPVNGNEAGELIAALAREFVQSPRGGKRGGQ